MIRTYDVFRVLHVARKILYRVDPTIRSGDATSSYQNTTCRNGGALFFQYEKLSEGSKLFSFTNLEMSINKL